jgi:hypothetical protein
MPDDCQGTEFADDELFRRKAGEDAENQLFLILKAGFLRKKSELLEDVF